ncbi:MAG: hypothetical protein V3U92_14865 [Cellulophaga sp.]
MIENLYTEIVKGNMPIHLISIQKKKQIDFVKDKSSKKLKTSNLQISPLYKTSI